MTCHLQTANVLWVDNTFVLKPLGGGRARGVSALAPILHKWVTKSFIFF